MRIIHTGELRGFSVGERFLMFLFAVLPGNHTIDCVADYARAISGRPPNMPVLRETIRTLLAEEIFEEGTAARGVQGHAYRLTISCSWKSLQLLAADATKHNWWPTPAVISGGLAGAWLGAELAYGVRNFVEPMQVWQVAESMRALLTDDVCGAYGLPPGARYPLPAAHWTAIERVLDLLDPVEPAPSGPFPPKSAELMVPALLELSFLRGVNVQPALEAVRTLLAAPGVRPSTALFCAYGALCVWTGRRDLLTGLVRVVPAGSPGEHFAALCLDVFEGRFEEAERAFTSGWDGFRGVLPTDVSTPVCLLGIALALRVEAPLARVAKYAGELKREPELLNWHPAGRSAFRDVLRRRNELVDRLMCAAAPNWRAQPKSLPSFVDQLLVPKRAYAAGYPTLAIIYAAEILRADPETPHVDEFCELLTKNGAVSLTKGVAREPEWRVALRALDACLPAKGAQDKAEQTLKGAIAWNFELSTAPRTGGEMLYSCVRLEPAYRGPRAAEDGRDDRRLTLKGLAAAKYRACLTSVDAEVLQELQRAGYNARVPYSVPEAALELLCGHPRLTASVLGGTAEESELRAITLTRQLCEMTTATDDAGGLRLTLPKWIYETPQTGYAIRRAEGEGYLYHPLPKRVRDVVAVFAAQAEDGKLTIPKEALAEAKGILVRLAGVMSLGGTLAVEGGGDFRRVAGDPTPHVRLVYANDALSLALVVEPLPNRAVAACEPGVGRTERLVQLRGGRTVLLVRALEAETAAAEPVRTALSAFDAWATGKNRWLVTSAEDSLEALRTLRELEGVKLDWPEGEKIRVTRPSAGGVKIEASGTDWFAVGGEVTLDDGRVMALMDLLSALENREGNYVRFGENDYVYLSNELLRRMEALATVVTSSGGAEGKGVRNQVSPAALPMLEEVFGAGNEGLPHLPEILSARVKSIQKAFAEKVEAPRRFKGNLRPYQETGYAWLEHLAACGFGACLADDMGLGKTVQIIALLLRRTAEGASLVVAPASVCVNWIREIERFAPTLRPVTLWGEKSLPQGLGAGDVVVASYGLLVSRAEDFASVDWNGVVLDEAQAVKNAVTQRAHAAGRLRAKFRIAATGTPVENRLAEFWSIFSFLNPGLLGTQREFEARFTEAGFATKELKRIVEPFVLRRLKRDVLKELPEKTEVTLRVALGEDERLAYEACRRSALAGLRERGETENRVSILAALMRLRRFCCHPSLVMPEMKASAKLDAVLELLGNLREGGHRALVFSQFVDYLAIVREAVEARGWSYRYLDGTTPQAERAASVDAFQRGDGDFFLISLKAGGTGLNLTAANYVLLLDPWWNPAVEDQAADRAHRIGQKLPVTVYRVVAENTVEDRILDLHGDKRAVSEDLLESAKGTALTPETLMGLFGDDSSTSAI